MNGTTARALGLSLLMSVSSVLPVAAHPRHEFDLAVPFICPNADVACSDGMPFFKIDRFAGFKTEDGVKLNRVWSFNGGPCTEGTNGYPGIHIFLKTPVPAKTLSFYWLSTTQGRDWAVILETTAPMHAHAVVRALPTYPIADGSSGCVSRTTSAAIGAYNYTIDCACALASLGPGFSSSKLTAIYIIDTEAQNLNRFDGQLGVFRATLANIKVDDVDVAQSMLPTESTCVAPFDGETPVF